MAAEVYYPWSLKPKNATKSLSRSCGFLWTSPTTPAQDHGVIMLRLRNVSGKQVLEGNTATSIDPIQLVPPPPPPHHHDSHKTTTHSQKKNILPMPPATGAVLKGKNKKRTPCNANRTFTQTLSAS